MGPSASQSTPEGSAVVTQRFCSALHNPLIPTPNHVYTQSITNCPGQRLTGVLPLYLDHENPAGIPSGTLYK